MPVIGFVGHGHTQVEDTGTGVLSAKWNFSMRPSHSYCELRQDNKNDVNVLNQRSPAPDPMFGVPGVGHNKPSLLSPGILPTDSLRMHLCGLLFWNTLACYVV